MRFDCTSLRTGSPNDPVDRWRAQVTKLADVSGKAALKQKDTITFTRSFASVFSQLYKFHQFFAVHISYLRHFIDVSIVVLPTFRPYGTMKLWEFTSVFHFSTSLISSLRFIYRTYGTSSIFLLWFYRHVVPTGR